jgi:hypothetical protein
MTEQEEQFCIVDMLFRTYAKRCMHRYVSTDAAWRAMWSLFERGAIEVVLCDDGDSVDVKFVSMWRQAKRRRNAAAVRPLVEIYHRRELSHETRPYRSLAG